MCRLAVDPAWFEPNIKLPLALVLQCGIIRSMLNTNTYLDAVNQANGGNLTADDLYNIEMDMRADCADDDYFETDTYEA